MTDKFTLTLEYDRDEILDWVKKCIAMGGDIYQTKNFLDQIFPAWARNLETSCRVELMFRDENDPLHELFAVKLAEIQD